MKVRPTNAYASAARASLELLLQITKKKRKRLEAVATFIGNVAG
jgi:hypothetical protein